MGSDNWRSRQDCRTAAANKKAAGVAQLSGSVRPPPEVLAERDRVLSAPRSPNMEILGDPLPGRDALDRVNHE
jgi:hypothetical protein